MSDRFSESFKKAVEEDPNAFDVWEAVQILDHDAGSGLKRLQELANNGSSLSMFFIGDAYGSGRGIPVDLDLCVRWLEKAEQAGSIEAAFRLAYMYWSKGDYQMALELFSKLSRRGYAPGTFYLGRMFYLGNGVKKDLQKAKEYWREAGRKGHIYATNNLSYVLRKESRGIANKLIGYVLWIYSVFAATAYSIAYPESDKIRIN